MTTLHHGDCLEVLRGMPDNSVDSIVTDPPYGLSFMGRKWDYDVPSVDVWAECLRVLKPGGHLLAFAGTRTQHHMAVRIEDAGFEIRDMIAWVYGSGFPKSLDVSKAIDKAGGDALAWRAFSEAYASAVSASDLTHSDIDRSLGIKSSSCYWARTDHRGGMPPRHHWEKVREMLALPAEFSRLYDEAEREVVGQKTSGIANKDEGERHTIGAGSSVMVNITAPATEAARQWSGWGTALKPALEPITVARKPLIGTVAENVLAHGTGAINVDACRIMQEGQERDADAYRRLSSLGSASYIRGLLLSQIRGSLLHIASVLRSYSTGDTGRLRSADDLDGTLLDLALCERLVARLFPNGAWCGGSSWSVPDSLCGCQSCRHSCDEHTRLLREVAQGGAPSLADALERICSGRFGLGHNRECRCNGRPSSSDDSQLAWSFSFLVGEYCTLYSATPKSARWPANLIHDGSDDVTALLDEAARFFYCAKASKRDRGDGNNHPTVKPTDLMAYLCRLVTPPGGVVLDPFMGSGSTGKAAVLEGFRFIGIEREAEYLAIAQARIKHASQDGRLL